MVDLVVVVATEVLVAEAAVVVAAILIVVETAVIEVIVAIEVVEMMIVVMVAVVVAMYLHAVVDVRGPSHEHRRRSVEHTQDLDHELLVQELVHLWTVDRHRAHLRGHHARLRPGRHVHHLGHVPDLVRLECVVDHVTVSLVGTYNDDFDFYFFLSLDYDNNDFKLNECRQSIVDCRFN